MLINFVDQVLRDAVSYHASDIHFEPYDECYRIRFRIDGLLSEVRKISKEFGLRLSTRFKVMANLDIAERRLPQDGRFTWISADLVRDCRLSVCPTLFGEKLVVRILNPTNAPLNLEYLGLNAREQSIFCKYIHMPQGLVLVTGPTGSGKTLTLYTVLNILNETAKNISTVEDPIEISLYGINQVEVNNKIGLDFAKVLRAFLRQDPDVIMIGEIRDLETAQIAIRAAYTGHLVLATLHTNSAISSLIRLLNMGIPAFDLSSAVSLIIAQRLVRKLCMYCKRQDGLGCEYCNNGYSGRMAIFEMLPIVPVISEIILSGCSQADIEKQMQILDMPVLYEKALKLVSDGVINLEEVNRVVV